MPAATSNCRNRSCRTKVEGQVAICPDCGGKMQTPRLVRTMGWLLLFCGAFIAGLMGYIANLMAPSMNHPGELAGGMTFNGTAQQAQSIFMLFGAIIVFGLASILYGLWMIVTGRRSIVLMIGVLALAVVLVGSTLYTLRVLPR